MNSNFAQPDDAEAAFYLAFRQCDPNAMQAVWANDKVVCVHPGSAAIIGYEAVLRSWQHIFANAALPHLQTKVMHRIANDNLAIHVVEEQIATGDNTSARVLATNVYRKQDGRWLMVEHHGSLIQMQSEQHTLQ